jgi:membrane-associated protease RseP (regulator of RpoE activity)
MKKTDQGDRIDHNLVHQPNAEPTSAQGLQEFGGDRHSLVADAMFVDLAAGDYRVKEHSPALKLGFRNFAMDRFGVRKPELKRIAKRPPLPGSIEAAAIRSGGWDREYATPTTATWLGATLRDLTNINEKSAVGLGEEGGVLVAEIASRSRATELGLKENDVILGINGAKVDNLKAFSDQYQAAALKEMMTLRVWRNQAALELRTPATEQ